tara:strand:- start:636 stop:1937 length:1302 start_codon:yes stop_codon:yes gene_type:complete
LDYNSLLILISFIFFLFLSAFFSSSETAFTAINRLKLRQFIQDNDILKTRFEKIYSNPKRLLTAILIGNNIANVATSATATAVLLNALSGYGITNLAAAMSIITTVITILLLIFGEITPKTIALKHPEKLACLLSAPIRLTILIMYPIIIVFEFFSLGIIKFLKLETNIESKQITIEEMKAMVEVGSEEGLLEKDKKEMLTSIFEFSDTVVREIMTPRTDTICIDVCASIQDAIHLIMDKGHSRIPVFEEKIDNIIGIIYAKDLLSVTKENSKEPLRKFMRDPIFIPESKTIESLLHQMKVAKFHLAIVVDEYGGMAGIATLEDIIEEIIGEIHDEYDTSDDHHIREIDTHTYEVSAIVNMKELGDFLERDFPENDDYDTVGGMVLNELGKFPKKGEQLVYESLLIKVKEVSKKRILTLIIQSKPKNEESENK